MELRASFKRIVLLLSAVVLAMTACSSSEPAGSAPIAYGPLPSPKPAFTGIPLPATLEPVSATPSSNAAQETNGPTATASSARASAQGTVLTILYTNDTRGYVDPCG